MSLYILTGLDRTKERASRKTMIVRNIESTPCEILKPRRDASPKILRIHAEATKRSKRESGKHGGDVLTARGVVRPEYYAACVVLFS